MKNEQSNTPAEHGNLLFSRGSDGFDIKQNWLTTDFIPSDSFGVMYGKSSSLKTFLALEMSCSIATGTDWNGKKVDAGIVIYIAGEGERGVSRRVKAWELANNSVARNLYVLGRKKEVSQANVQDEIIASIQDIEAQSGLKAKLIVLDTVARHFTGNENCPSAMGDFIQGCDRIRHITQTTILCIHHTGKDASKGARGSGALLGACDFEFLINRSSKTLKATLINTKQKDCEEAPTLELEYDIIDLGITCESNNPVTSLARTKKMKLKTEGEQLLLDPIVKALKTDFEGSSTRDDIRHKIYSKEVVDSWTNSNTKDFYRQFEKLETAGIVLATLKGKRRSMADVIALAA
ncbi:AAA family ATPase [Vibrio superstes]|uniref:Uncharacterized protein n=1 Tax=Vibrio superstes NBRC 103154 TaxID=1219062 RepID=A0A511QN43_9VIBR|nr:AAA family ATPase [Vibrio superstes]GEM78740.1 hypothetical protein VSU01S_09850 [Vibrio superstes NBRC 103154]